ncbi:hypothetical protein J6590_000254 [Homalodisca vitripennis]|nr:hypothetical protein J6590_000254 [Homalodisca vitripennis]
MRRLSTLTLSPSLSLSLHISLFTESFLEVTSLYDPPEHALISSFSPPPSLPFQFEEQTLLWNLPEVFVTGVSTMVVMEGVGSGGQYCRQAKVDYIRHWQRDHTDPPPTHMSAQAFTTPSYFGKYSD